MSEQSRSRSFVPKDSARRLQHAGVTDEQLAALLRSSVRFRGLLTEYVELLDMGFTLEDIVLAEEVDFPLSYYRNGQFRTGDDTGHEDLWYWIELQYMQYRANQAEISLSEFTAFWRKLCQDVSYPEQKSIMKEYLYARRYTDIPARVLQLLPRELRDVSKDYDRHTIRRSYVPLARLCWTHEQIMDILEMVDTPMGVKYVREVARKGVWYEPIFDWLHAGLDIEDLAYKLRIPGAESTEIKEVVAFLLRNYHDSIGSTSSHRVIEDARSRVKNVLSDYHDSRYGEGLSHEKAMIKAIDTFHPVP